MIWSIIDLRKCLGAIRKASDKFDLIQDGDRIAVGVSGGKDSVALLYAFNEYINFSDKKFTFFGICIDLGNKGFDVSPIDEMCQKNNIDFYTIKTDISDIVFNRRKEKSPCSLCAKLRKGALIKEARKLGANKVALGHHRDDLLETFVLSMMYEGKLNALSPKTYLDRQEVTQIRPFIYLEEKHIKNFVIKNDLPICESFCTIDGATKRSEAKEILKFMENKNPNTRKIMTTAITNNQTYKLW